MSSRGDTLSFDFARATCRRVTPQNLALAMAIGFPLTLAQQVARNILPHASDLRMLKVYPLPAPPITAVVGATGLLCLTMLLGILAADEAVARGVSPLRAYLTGVIAGGLFGALSTATIRLTFDVAVGFMARGRPTPVQPLVVASLAISNGAFIAIVYWRLQVMRRARAKRHAAEVARGEVRRRTIESTLQAMQARVEPDFLFRTLERIHARFDSSPALASEMLDDLVEYLRAAVPHHRQTTSTVAKEIALVRAFFAIHPASRERGHRLTVDIDPAAASAALPPMILLPLLTVCLQHFEDIDAQDDEIVVAIGLVDRKLRVMVEGPAALAGAGAARAVIEQTNTRLSAMFDRVGGLVVEHHATDAAGARTRLRLELPHESIQDDHR